MTDQSETEQTQTSEAQPSASVLTLPKRDGRRPEYAVALDGLVLAAVEANQIVDGKRVGVKASTVATVVQGTIQAGGTRFATDAEIDKRSVGLSLARLMGDGKVRHPITAEHVQGSRMLWLLNEPGVSDEVTPTGTALAGPVTAQMIEKARKKAETTAKSAARAARRLDILTEKYNDGPMGIIVPEDAPEDAPEDTSGE